MLWQGRRRRHPDSALLCLNALVQDQETEQLVGSGGNCVAAALELQTAGERQHPALVRMSVLLFPL
jgi:hypothetical protein